MTSLVALAEMLALPVVEASAPACTNFPTDHPLHQGYSARPFLDEADVILLLESATPWGEQSGTPDHDGVLDSSGNCCVHDH